ncbi:MAG: hypothetical protein WCH39_22270 [Schlesneria sp.]
MTQSRLPEFDVYVDNLLNHIQARTFGRLHGLNVLQLSDGRVQVSAVAHSRFVSQLAEWAVFERMAPEDVDLSISVRLSTPHFNEVQK